MTVLENLFNGNSVLLELVDQNEVNLSRNQSKLLKIMKAVEAGNISDEKPEKNIEENSDYWCFFLRNFVFLLRKWNINKKTSDPDAQMKVVTR